MPAQGTGGEVTSYRGACMKEGGGGGGGGGDSGAAIYIHCKNKIVVLTN